MTSFLNNLLYCNNDFVSSNDIVKLRDFMLTRDNKENIINKSLSNIQKIENNFTKTEVLQNNSYEDKQDYQHNKNEYIEPMQHDTLFWCCYIIAYGYKDYLQIGRNYGVRELEEKQKILEFVKTNSSKVKNTNYKITNVAIQEILSELMTVQKQTSMLVLISMLVYYNINLLIVDKTGKCMLEFWANKDNIPRMDTIKTDDNALTYILYKNEQGKYKLQLENLATSKIYELKNNLIVLDHYNKSLKSMTNYKVDELETMAKKLGLLNDNKKYKKNELYDLVSEFCKC
jgi:hypothetical protein